MSNHFKPFQDHSRPFQIISNPMGCPHGVSHGFPHGISHGRETVWNCLELSWNVLIWFEMVSHAYREARRYPPKCPAQHLQIQEHYLKLNIRMTPKGFHNNVYKDPTGPTELKTSSSMASVTSGWRSPTYKDANCGTLPAAIVWGLSLKGLLERHYCNALVTRNGPRF